MFYRRRLHLLFTGCESEFHKYKAGMIVLMRMIEDLFRESPDIRELDFGFGDAT